MSTSGGYNEYIAGCSVHRRDTMSTSGMFSTLGDIMIHVGDTMSTSGDVQYIRRCHEYIGGISWIHRGDIMSTSGDVQ